MTLKSDEAPFSETKAKKNLTGQDVTKTSTKLYTSSGGEPDGIDDKPRFHEFVLKKSFKPIFLYAYKFEFTLRIAYTYKNKWRM